MTSYLEKESENISILDPFKINPFETGIKIYGLLSLTSPGLGKWMNNWKIFIP